MRRCSCCARTGPKPSTSTRWRPAPEWPVRRSTAAFGIERALLTATLELFADAPFPAADLPVEDKLRWVLDQVRELVEEQLGRGAIAAVLADSDPAFSTALRARLRRRLEALQVQIDADVASGRLRDGIDVESLAGVAFGAYLGEALQHGRVRPGWADGVADLLLRGISS